MFLVFAFSGCTGKNRGDTTDFGESGINNHNRKKGGWVGQQKLLYRAAVESGLLNEGSVEGLVVDYRESLYGNLFLENYLSSRIEISLEEIRVYYLTNRLSYLRHSNEVQVIQFLTQKEASAIRIKRTLLQYDADLRLSLLEEHGVSPTTVSPGELPQSLDLLLFGSSVPRGVLGPKKTSFGYHVLEVLEFFPEGSFRGLNEVYDEISQNLYQEQREALYGHLLDSLGTIYSLEVNKTGGT